MPESRSFPDVDVTRVQKSVVAPLLREEQDTTQGPRILSLFRENEQAVVSGDSHPVTTEAVLLDEGLLEEGIIEEGLLEEATPAVTTSGAKTIAEELEAQLSAEALGFLVGGAVHKMNNVLSIFLSLTQMFELQGPGWSPIRKRKDVIPLRDSVEAGRDVIALLTELSPAYRVRHGHSGIELQSICAGSFLQHLGQILLCEDEGLRYPVLTRSEPQVYIAMPKRQLACIVLLLIQHVLGEAQGTYAGRLEIGASEKEGAPVVHVRFCLPPDHLPFAVPPMPLDPRLVSYCDILGVGIEPISEESGYRLRFAPA